MTRVDLPWTSPPLSGNDRGHTRYRSHAVSLTLVQARAAVRNAKVTPVVGAEVTLHYRPKDKRRRDADNLAPMLKECLDALVLEGVLPDDSWVHVPRSTNEIHPPEAGKPGEMWLTVTELP